MTDRTAPSVEILLATCNSADYLAALLDSLVAQSWTDFRLVVSDDCSTDATLAILEAAVPRFARAPEIIRRDRPSGSASANFATLLARSGADYVFLADHDDVWLPDKVAAGVARLQAAEARLGRDTPVLVHCDLRVVDGALGEIAPSYWRFKSITPAFGQRLPTALMHATVTGCAAAMNRALVRLVGSPPPQAVMHDWWINLVAAAFGAVEVDPEPRILYRVHGRNVSRPARVSPLSMLMRRAKALGVRDMLRRRVVQAQALLDRFGEDLPPEARRTAENFAGLARAGFLGRRLRVLRGGHFFPEWWRNLAVLAMA